MISVYSYDTKKDNFTYGQGISFLSEELKTQDFANWVDLQNPTDEEYAILESFFKFHPLAVEDCKHFSLFPKFDEYDDYLFIVFHDIQMNLADGFFNCSDEEKYAKLKTAYAENFDAFELKISEIDIFTTSNTIVTVHGEALPSIDRLSEKFKKRIKAFKNGRDFILHEITDAIVDQYVQVSYVLDEVVEILEDEVITKCARGINDKIVRLKRDFLLFRRSLMHEKSIMEKLMFGPQYKISKRALYYLKDIHDHLMRVFDSVEINREMLSIILDAYLSTMSNQMNKAMMKLTTIATIFMPLTFVAGIYGMNFKNFPEIEWQYGYLYVWIVFIAIGVYSYNYFRKKELI